MIKEANELVSVITPSYNTEKYIIETIKSVQKQTYTNWEMIIVDDCSTDCTVEIVKKYIKETNDKRIRLLINNKNSGAAISRNYALKLSKGKWIAFLDSDDLWDSKKLERQISFMKANNYHFSYTEYSEINETGEKTHVTISGPRHIGKIGMYNYCWPGCLTVMYDKDIIGDIQIENISKNNDYAMWVKAIKKSDCWLLKENLAQYRKRKGSISDSKYSRLIYWHYLLFRKCDNKNIAISVLYTLRNIFFGFIKKIIYVKHEGNKI